MRDDRGCGYAGNFGGADFARGTSHLYRSGADCAGGAVSGGGAARVARCAERVGEKIVSSAKFKPVEEQLAYLKKGVAEIIREEELKAKLTESVKAGKPLRVYLGVGPTAQSETRPPLKAEQVQKNAETYLQQVFKILDKSKTEVRYNNEWLGKLSSTEVVQLCAHYRLARMLEREDFRSRLDANQPISVHELLYPLLTAYDAVALKSDVELGATEQKFNLLVHREIQREYGLPAQVILTMPILVGLD